MKKTLGLWPLVLCLSWLVCACTEENETVVSTDCYIHSFSLGNVKRQVTTTVEGRDTTYDVTFNASYYPMTVDQLAGTIANEDSLPVNSRVNAVLATVEAQGTVVYRKADEAEGEWHSYSSSDSIDFTTPLVFRVYSADYVGWRDYTVRVNVHQQEGDEFTWRKAGEPGLWDGADSLKAVAWDGGLWVFASTDGQVRAFSASLPDGTTWKEQPLAGCAAAQVTTLAAWKGCLYMSRADGVLLSSGDALTWDVVAADRPLELLAADETALYAWSDGGIWRSVDGQEWVAEPLDESPDWLPSQDFASVAYVQENGVRRILLAGNRPADAYPEDPWAMLWSRSTEVPGGASHWAYFNVAPDNAYACPRLSGLNLVRYGEVLLAFGGKPLGGVSHEALEAFYVSEDNGVTWKNDGVYVLPDALRGLEAPVSGVADSGSRLWLVAGGQVWRGQLNSLGFAGRVE